MFGHDFYHGTLRRYVIMFGNLFNEIQVDRYDTAGTKLQTVNVPIEYGPKQKFIQRVTSDPDLNRHVSTTLPRLGFEFTSMSYAPQRKLNSAHKITKGVNTGGLDFNYMHTPVPYDFNFSLHALFRNTEDGTQIVEQIVPFFTPDFTVTMKMIPEMSLNMDIPIELNSVTSSDTYELRCDRLEYSSERINTDITEIDANEDQYSLSTANNEKLLDEDAFLFLHEDGTFVINEADVVVIAEIAADNEEIGQKIIDDDILDFSEQNPFSLTRTF